MKITAISDLHGKCPVLAEGDLLIVAGDLAQEGREPSFYAWLEMQPYVHKVYIAGNHDWHLIGCLPKSEGSVHYLMNSGVEISGLKIWGSPFTPRFGNWAFMDNRGECMARHWDIIPEDTDILVTHGPPKGILDRTVRGVDAGCEALVEHLKTSNIKYHIFGHIHEGYGRLNKDGIHYLNVSYVDEFYRPKNLPVEIII